MKKQDKGRILIFGRGQLASFFSKYFPEVVISAADITKPSEIEKEFAKHKPEVVVNTAAKTSIDWCELNKMEAFEVNSLGAFNVWEAAQKYDSYMCHFSSGCIFHSGIHDEIYTENDTPNPKCYYSWTKVWAENLLGKSERLLVLRPRVIISTEISRRNTLAKWLTYSHFISDQNSVTIVEDMFPILQKMFRKRISGTFNIVNKGTISPLEIAHILKEKINPEMKIEETTLAEINENLVGKRVSTILDTSSLSTIGFDMPAVLQSFEKVVQVFEANLNNSGGLSALRDVKEDTRHKYSLKGKTSTTFSDVN